MTRLNIMKGIIMAKKEEDNKIKEEEKQAEAQAEAEEKLDKEPSKEEAGSNPDEAAEVGAQVEESAGAREETPAEVEAVNTDNETAKEATESVVKDKPVEEQAKTEKKPGPTGKFKDLIKEIEGLTALELAELVKTLEERFGVSAAAPMAAAPQAGGDAAGPQEEEKTNFTVVLSDSGSQKIAVIKALREINQELGLKEAKDIADAPPKDILKDVPKDKAEEAKKKLEEAGAKVELK